MKRYIAEFEGQSFTQIIFPHKNSDWNSYLEEARANFVDIIESIREYQRVLVICDNTLEVKSYFATHQNIEFVEYETDDTWARDISAISIINGTKIELLDFKFNAWGDKYKSTKDDKMSRAVKGLYKSPLKSIDMVLEGGAVDSNGDGLILSTSKCILNPNRNPNLSDDDIRAKLCSHFGASHILCLHHGYLAGDDTDSHVDTLARFIDKKTIMFVGCRDKNDEHFRELKLMKKELEHFASIYDLRLIELPLPTCSEYKGERLPATYANFLFVNGAVLVPTYGVKEDKEAIEIFKKSIKNRKIIPINCQTLIKERGSLHCVTMNFAKKKPKPKT